MSVLRAESRRVLKWCVQHGEEFTQGEARNALGVKQASLSHIIVRLLELEALRLIAPMRKEAGRRGSLPAVYIVTEYANTLANEQLKPANGYVGQQNETRSQFANVSSIFHMGAR
jgi:hypothetical protein